MFNLRKQKQHTIGPSLPWLPGFPGGPGIPWEKRKQNHQNKNKNKINCKAELTDTMLKGILYEVK